MGGGGGRRVKLKKAWRGGRQCHSASEREREKNSMYKAGQWKP